KYFDWLDEVVLSAKEARGETLIPKTPARKRNKKIVEDIENVPPLLPPPPPPVENVRKSSRAAAKAAHEKTKKTIQEISNIGTKMRRPSTPPRVKTVEFISVLDEKNERVENSADVSKPPSILEHDLPETPHSEVDDKIEDINNFEIIDEEKSNSEYSNDDDMDEKVLSLKDNPSKVEEITKLPYLELIDINHKEHHQDEDEHKFTKPTRTTRTKKRIAETVDTAIPVQPEEVVIRSTRSKRRKIEEEITQSKKDVESRRPACIEEHLISNQLSCKSTLSDSQPIIVTINNEPSINQPPEDVPLRMTRSKVRKINPKTSPSQKETIDECPPKQLTPVKMNSNRNHLTSKAKIESSILIKNSDSPSKNLKTKKLNNFKPSEANVICNRSIDRNEMCSPLVIKHFRSATLKSGTSTKKSFQTPSPISSSTVKAISTPAEASRVKNIVMGPSFLTKVLPNKPTKEETEEKKKEEMRRKREREEEIRKKREEMLKMQRDEKKRKNEERMRKVQESRELEKIEAEAREMQEKEKKQREERLKEEKRRKLMELKKIEEMKLKKQVEEERRLQEQRHFEEQKAMEELRRAEERKKLEEKRLQEREAERILREKLEMEKIREGQRIAREKEEIDRLKAKEARNLESEKMNETYTTNTEHPLNTTYSKPAQNSTVEKSEEVQSYEMTPVAEKKKPKSKSAEDYGINDLRSDDSTDDECAPKKTIPNWAGGNMLRKQLFYQEHIPPDLDAVFPPNVLLQMPDLSKIFAKRRSRFYKRTSSAVWNTPPYKVLAPNR
ncbi:Inner centromere protein, partial [Armadillidium nasatum]